MFIFAIRSKGDNEISMRKLFSLLLAVILIAFCGCSDTGDLPKADNSEIQYDYQLKAGEPSQVYDMTFEEMVTVTVDPASMRSGTNDTRSSIYFGNCTFNGGLTIVGDYHAMISLGEDCSFGDDSSVICREATSGAARDITLDDNFVKVFVACDGVSLETNSAVGVLSDGPDIVLNGKMYRKDELAPSAAYLGVYSIWENGTMTYIKLAVSEDDSVQILD